MSVLTKVLVTLLTVSSIALSMLVVGAFAKQENWRQTAMNFEKDFQAEAARSRALSSQLEVEKGQYLDQIASLRGDKSNLENELSTARNQISELELGNKEAQNSVKLANARVDSSLGLNSQLQTALTNSEEFANKLTARNSELQRRNIDLNSRVEELITNLQMARHQVRALQQQITTMEETHLAVGRKAPGSAVPAVGSGGVEEFMPSATMSQVAAVSPIKGEITRIEGNLASISVGSTDGVTAGMKFLIFRRIPGSGPRYLGTLKVSRVEANNAAGMLEHHQGDIRPGDTARDKNSFGRRG